MPGSKIDDCHIKGSLVTEGVILNRSHIDRCVVGIRSRIGAGTTLRETVMMGADFYQVPEQIQEDVDRGLPPIGIGEGSVIERAIVDKNARIGRGVRIVNQERRVHHDADTFYIRDGIVVIPKDVVIPDGTEI